VLKSISLFLLGSLCASAEVHQLTLRQAADQALRQNPDLIVARLDEQKAREGVRIAKDPFVPKVYGGSGLAYTSGYPSSIEGNAPAIFEAKTSMALFNRPKSFDLAVARQNARTAAIGTQSQSDAIVFQTATLFLDAQQLARSTQSLEREVEALGQVSEAVHLRVGEGREIPLEDKRAEVDLARARQRFEGLAADRDYAESSLAIILGFPAGDRVEPVEGEDHAPLPAPESEQAAVAAAVENNKDLRRLESQMEAKGYEIRGYKSYRLPQFDLVAQYALLARRNYRDYFQKFQRNNGQLGVSIQIPLLVGSAARGYVSQAEEDLIRLRTQVAGTRNRLEVETRKSFHDLKRAESGREVARLDLDFTREQVSVLLAQLGEGRVSQQAVDQARLAEQERWIAFYDSQHAVERARLALLNQTGTLLASLK
jgi:outer membrane protein